MEPAHIHHEPCSRCGGKLVFKDVVECPTTGSLVGAFSGAKTAVTFIQLNADLVAQSGHEWIRNRRNQHWFCNPVTDLHKFVGTFGGRSQLSACPLFAKCQKADIASLIQSPR